MIPTMLLVGLVIGRRWAVWAGALGWAMTLLVTGTIVLGDVPLAGGLAAANVAAGVLVHWVIGQALKIRRRLSAAA